MESIEAIYEHGVFRPLKPVSFAEGARVNLHNLRIISVEPGQDLDAAQRTFEDALRASNRTQNA